MREFLYVKEGQTTHWTVSGRTMSFIISDFRRCCLPRHSALGRGYIQIKKYLRQNLGAKLGTLTPSHIQSSSASVYRRRQLLGHFSDASAAYIYISQSVSHSNLTKTPQHFQYPAPYSALPMCLILFETLALYKSLSYLLTYYVSRTYRFHLADRPYTSFRSTAGIPRLQCN